MFQGGDRFLQNPCEDFDILTLHHFLKYRSSEVEQGAVNACFCVGSIPTDTVYIEG